MSIYLHPTAATSPALIRDAEAATGRVAIAASGKVLLLTAGTVALLAQLTLTTRRDAHEQDNG